MILQILSIITPQQWPTVVTKSAYHQCGVFVSVAYFRVNLAGCSGEFHIVFKHFENLKNLILNVLKEKLHIP